MRKSALIAGAIVLSLAANASAEVWIPTYFRCTHDQLNNAQGTGRLAWATKYRGSNPYNFMGGGGRDPRFLSSPNAKIIAESPGSPVIYPVYLDKNDNPWTAGPGGPTSTSGATPPSGYVNIDYSIKPVDTWNDGLCEAGCYTPDQQILFADKEVEIAKAEQIKKSNLVTLSAESVFGNLQLIPNPVLQYTMDQKPARQLILTFRMQSGGRLSVTTEHPLVTMEGSLRKAKLMEVGQSLVKPDGTPDEILSIEEDDWFGRVYNLKPVSTNLTENILVAQGYLNGSGRYQSEYVQELNRILLRETVPTELIPGS